MVKNIFFYQIVLLKYVNTNTLNYECKLLDWTETREQMVEECWFSNNPKILVHHIPVGPDAVRIWVDVVMKPNVNCGGLLLI